jgi:hypothetical protein
MFARIIGFSLNFLGLLILLFHKWQLNAVKYKYTEGKTKGRLLSAVSRILKAVWILY